VEALCEDISLETLENFCAETWKTPIKIVTRAKGGIYWDKEKGTIRWAQKEEYYFAESTIIIRTEDGDKLTVEDLRPVYYRLRARKYRSWKDAKSRGRRRSVYGKFRHIRTTNERRQSFANRDEEEPFVRARRNHKNLPSEWADQYSRPQRGWKWQSKRRKQWRP
jgi:hypothetical protein